ncbi:hypothetical protein ACWGIB_06770 [Streptomyces xiamenensis]
MLIGTFCTLLTAAGLGVAFLVAKRRRYATALRVAAFSLLPVGLAMTGVVRFVLNMTFNPVAWAGLGVIGLAVLIFFVAGFADRRRLLGHRGHPEEARHMTRPSKERIPAQMRCVDRGEAGRCVMITATWRTSPGSSTLPIPRSGPTRPTVPPLTPVIRRPGAACSRSRSRR